MSSDKKRPARCGAGPVVPGEEPAWCPQERTDQLSAASFGLWRRQEAVHAGHLTTD